MNIEEAYQWLHGNRTEYSGCRAAAETYNAALTAANTQFADAQAHIKQLEKGFGKLQLRIKELEEQLLCCTRHNEN